MHTRILAILVLLLPAACTSSASRERAAFREFDPERAAVIAAALNEAQEPPPAVHDGVLALPALIREAELRSPRLAAAYQKWRASVSGITTSTALPDARLSYTYFMNSIDERVGPIEHRLMLEQMVPNPGKLVARQEAAAGNARAMRANFEATRLGLREQLLSAYADLQALDSRISVIERMAEILRDIEQVVEARVTAGLTPQSALLRIQVEAERLESDARTLERRRPALIATLEAVTGLALPEDARTDPAPEGAAPALPRTAALLAHTLAHPTLEAEFAKVAIASARVDEAGWMWVPDFMFGFEYMVMDRMENRMADEGRQAIGLTAGITIPWQFHVNKARDDAAKAEEQAARFMAEQQRLDLTSRLAAQEFAYGDAARLIELYTVTVLPKARQTLELMRGDFTAERATLTDVLDAERSLLAAELSLINARADLLKARARIQSLIARDLETVEGE
jgi:outer membrane protein, heavy metal efflux system